MDPSFAPPAAKLLETGIPNTIDPAAGKGLTLDHRAAIPEQVHYTGRELVAVQFTANVTVTATTEGGSSTVVSSGAMEYDGRSIWVEFFCPYISTNTANTYSVLALFDSTSVIGNAGVVDHARTAGFYGPNYLKLAVTPSPGLHTYQINSYNSAASTTTFFAGSGGSATQLPGYIRISEY